MAPLELNVIAPPDNVICPNPGWTSISPPLAAEASANA
jgi:hypothetical protein